MKATLRHALIGGSLLLAISASLAGGPRAFNGLGQAMAWDTGGPVVYNPDQGPLGLFTNAEARALLAEAFAEWSGDINFTEGTLLPGDVDGAEIPFTNTAHYLHFYRVDGDGRSPVIFDHDGSIIDGIFGTGARFEILGVAGLDTPIGVDTEIDGASIVINGAFYDGVGLPSSPEDLSPLVSRNVSHAIIQRAVNSRGVDAWPTTAVRSSWLNPIATNSSDFIVARRFLRA